MNMMDPLFFFTINNFIVKLKIILANKKISMTIHKDTAEVREEERIFRQS